MADSTALWVTGRRTVQLRRAALHDCGEGEVRVRTVCSGLSRGTEALVLDGRVPAENRSDMRAPFQDGEFPFPVKYGYSNVGIAETGKLSGRTVFCLYPHQDVYIVPERDVVPVPEDVPAERAVLAANMETALNVVWDAGIAPGDRVAIVGCGVVGLLAAYLAARIPGTDVVATDIRREREGMVRGLGAKFCGAGDLPDDCDVVIHASATADGLRTAIGCGGFEARVVEASWFGEGDVLVALGGAFHSRRLSLVGSQVGSLPASRRARWTHRRRLETALSLLADPRLDCLISGESPFRDIERDYVARIDDPATLCHRFRYP